MNTVAPRKSAFARCFISLMAFLALGLAGQARAAGPEVVEVSSANSFDQTVQKLKSAITANDLVILKDLNQQMMVKMVGVNAEPSMSFEIFHPRYGKVLDANDRAAFIAAPLRILIQQDGDEVTVYYQKASVLFGDYSGLGDLGKELDTLFGKIVESATK